jgi:ribonuclease HI
MIFSIYCDGGFMPSNKTGAISANVFHQDKLILSITRHVKEKNNDLVESRAILLATIIAQDILRESNKHKVVIYSDSKFTVDFINSDVSYCETNCKIIKKIKSAFFLDRRLRLIWVSRKHEKIKFADKQCTKKLRENTATISEYKIKWIYSIEDRTFTGINIVSAQTSDYQKDKAGQIVESHVSTIYGQGGKFSVDGKIMKYEYA